MPVRNIRMGQPSVGEAEAEALMDCIWREQLSGGEMVAEFERQFGNMHGCHALATPSGTTALHLAVAALGIGKGDEVIVPATTYISTANAVAYTGAKVVVVDVDPDTWNIDVHKARQAISNRTMAIMAVHLFGVPCQMDVLEDFRRDAGILLIEDAAEALGATWGGQPVGSFGNAGCFSFYGNKTITTGEGGMLIAGRTIHQRAKHLGGVAQTNERYFHNEVGFNYRMSELQGAVGVAQFRKLPSILGRRRRVLKQYQEGLRQFRQQQLPDKATHGAWAFAIVLPDRINREGVQAKLQAWGIQTRPIFYPVNAMPMYADRRSMPVAEKLHQQGIMLPLHAELSEDDVDYVIQKVIEVAQ